MRKAINIVCALAWTVVFISCIFDCFNGNQPSWVVVFTPLVCVMLDSWVDVLNDRL